MLQPIRNRTHAHLNWHSHPLCVVASLVLACSVMESAISEAETPRTPLTRRCRTARAY